MSRHVLGHRTDPEVRFIVGYDRPVDAFYLQVWDPKQEEDAPAYVDDCFDLDLLPDIGAVIPDGFRALLVQEAMGTSDTNACKDWRLAKTTSPTA